MIQHPLDIASEKEREHTAPAEGSGWLALMVLVGVTILVVALVMAFSGDETDRQPQQPTPNEAPVEPGVS